MLFAGLHIHTKAFRTRVKGKKSQESSIGCPQKTETQEVDAGARRHAEPIRRPAAPRVAEPTATAAHLVRAR